MKPGNRSGKEPKKYVITKMTLNLEQQENNQKQKHEIQ